MGNLTEWLEQRSGVRAVRYKKIRVSGRPEGKPVVRCQEAGRVKIPGDQ